MEILTMHDVGHKLLMVKAVSATCSA